MKILKSIIASTFLSIFYSLNKTTFSLAANYIDCGTAKLPIEVPTITHAIIIFFQLVLPLLIIITVIIDYLKLLSEPKNNYVKSKEGNLAKRLVIATMCFLLVSVVGLIPTVFSKTTNLTSCLNCLVSGKNSCTGEVESIINPKIEKIDKPFKFPTIKDDAYLNDGSNSPSGTYQGPEVIETIPLNKVNVNQIGIGNNPNKTAANLYSYIDEPSGIEVKAKFIGYYILKKPGIDESGNLLDTSKQTCAAPPAVPYGSLIYIKELNGLNKKNYQKRIYTVTDRKKYSKINEEAQYVIPILFEDEKSAKEFGSQTGKIIIIER
ncbi:MAG: hypothetical protein RR659_00275 [Bacilli bacterium]